MLGKAFVLRLTRARLGDRRARNNLDSRKDTQKNSQAWNYFYPLDSAALAF